MKLVSIERLPSETVEAHAASIVYHEGHRVVTWFGGEREGIYCSIYAKVDTNEAVMIHTPRFRPGKYNSLWNPVIFSADGDLLMFHKEGKFCDSWQTFFSKCSIVDGKVVVEHAVNMPAGIHGTVKTKPYMEGNLLICGSSVETDFDWACYVEIFVYEKGKLSLLGRSHPIKNKAGQNKMKGILQPAIWKEGNIFHMLTRSSAKSSFIYHAQSKPDNPTLWSQATPTNINNPNSSIDVLQHSNGKLYMVCNPDAEQRLPLSVMETSITHKYSIPSLAIHNSLDINLEDGWLGMFKRRRTVELSYPYMIERPDGKIDIAHTCCRKEIRIATIEV